MKVKRFFAPTMAEALRQVREVMGPDAVILSNRKTDGGVEIVTALDYDENMARQKLGDTARDVTNGSKLAELQAEHHRKLEEELNRSRDRIREVRSRSTEETEQSFTPSSAHAADHREHSGSQAGAKPYQDELAQMRAEISSLKDLFSSGQGPQKESPQPVQQRLSERLMEFGLSPQLSTTLAGQFRQGRLEDGWKRTLKMLVAGLRTQRTEWSVEGGIYALVGPTGCGKTTTIGKMAARYVLDHGPDSIALVTTDRYRIAAHEQLFVFGRILNVPVRVVDERHSLDDILDDLSDRKLVLIDTAGLHSSDKGYQEQLRELATSRHNVRNFLVASATSQPRIMKSVWHCYKMAKLSGCVVTKTDEALTLGEVLGFAMESGLPIAYYTDGQKIPEDLHHADPSALVRLAVDRLKQDHQQSDLVG